MGHYTYLLINIFTIVFPIIWSFERKMFFYSKWKFAFKAILVGAVLFILNDFLFTYLGVWGFNPDYILGLYLFNLPIEEIFFFISVPFACLFIYETVFFLWRGRIKKGIMHTVSVIMSLVCLIVAVTNFDKAYTCFAFLTGGLLLTYHCAMKSTIDHEKFWIAYFFILIPFIVINGILTGYNMSKPVVWYYSKEILGLRLLTIPVEDFAYNLSLLLVNVTFYERFLKRS